MELKHQIDYDEIIDIEAESLFIKEYFQLNDDTDLAELEKQIYNLYDLELAERKEKISEDIGKPWYGEEFYLNNYIRNRNYRIACKAVLQYYRPMYPEDKNDEFDKIIRDYDEIIEKGTIDIINSCLLIFKAKGNNILFGKARNIGVYLRMLDKLTSKEIKNKQKNKKMGEVYDRKWSN